MIRLNKYLSEAGVCSRREADRLIESGIVTVDGKTAAPGMKVEDGQEVRVGKKVVKSKTEKTVLAVYKLRDVRVSYKICVVVLHELNDLML